MSSYGRNFECRIPPVHGSRGGRFYLPAGDSAVNLPIGVPVVVDTNGDPSVELSNALPVALATGETVIPAPGLGGIVVYEHAPAAYAGFDPVLTTFSDIDFVPVGKMCQVLQGGEVKVTLRNTVDRVFLHSRDYKGRTMVDGMGATPTVGIGDLLGPGDGDGESGGSGSYWTVTSDATKGWLVVVNVDAARGEVDCRLNF